jgi:hypothetical protein
VIALFHELAHRGLALRPFSQLKMCEIFIFYSMIFTAFEEGMQQIPVPLSHKLSRNKLEKQWGRIVRLHKASSLIEEALAVQSSLSFAREEGFIKTDQQMRSLIRQSKRAYGKSFEKSYNAYDCVVRSIGSIAALGMVHSAYRTLKPTAAFWRIISTICKIVPNGADHAFLWNLSPEKTHFLASLSSEEACDVFSNLIDDLDQDGSRYGIVDVSAAEEKTEQAWSMMSEDIRNDIAEFLFREPYVTLFSTFSYSIFPFYKTVLTDEEILEELEENMSFTLLLEAILQQLTQGRGLLCPFWLFLPHGCCSSRNKAFLERVWSCTKPDSSWRFWCRFGCLDE